MDDRSIVELYFARDERAIRETEVKYGKLCYEIARNILGNAQDAEECVNDTYAGLWNAIPPAQPDSFAAFACRVTRNLSLKKLAGLTRVKRNRDLTVSFAELEEILPDACYAGRQEGEITALINRFLKDQKEDVRNVFIRKYYFFDSVGAIAARYGFSQSKVKSMLYHTRNKLKEYLKREGIDV